MRKTKSKDFLTPKEFDRLLQATKYTRHSARDYLILLLLYKHGLRVSELTSMRVSQIDLESEHLHVKRLKHGLSTYHPLDKEELKLLSTYLQSRNSKSPYLFLSERKHPFTRYGIFQLLRKLGRKINISDLHPHMIRHSTGYALANKGLDTRLIQDYLGHRNIQSTVRYTQVCPERFRDIWV